MRLKLSYKTDAALLHHAAELIRSCGIHGQTWDRFVAQLELMTKRSKRSPSQPWLLASGPEGAEECSRGR